MYKKIAVFTAAAVLFCGISVAAEFTDIENHWAKETINELAEQGIIHGFDDSTVRPDEPVKVREYLKLILAATNKNIDFSSEHWSGEIIDYAVYEGYISENDFTDYDEYITRYDMMKITAKALGYAGTDYGIFLSKNGILSGDENGSLNESNNLTRAEAFTVIDRVLKSDEDNQNSEISTKPNGIVELLPDTATLTGEKIKIEDNTPLNVGNFGKGDMASWLVEVPETATYRVSILQARNHEGDKNGEFIIDDDQKLEFKSVDTGNWSSYTEVEIGEVELSAGMHSFCITSVNEDNFMNFRKIVLKDVELYQDTVSNEDVTVNIDVSTAELSGNDIKLENGMITGWKTGNSALFKFSLPETGSYEIVLTYECDSEEHGFGMLTFNDNKKRLFLTFKNDGTQSYNAGQFKLDAGDNEFYIYPNPMSPTDELMKLKNISVVKKKEM